MRTSLLDDAVPARGNHHPGSGGAATPLRTPGRVPWAVVGVLLILGSALVFAVLQMNAGSRRAVLAVARPVAAGQVIEGSHLRVIRVSADPEMPTVPAGERARVVGRAAAVSLAPDSLLMRSQLGTGATVGRGQSVVGLALKPGQLPVRLSPGDRVMVVRTAAPGAGQSPLGDEAAEVLARGVTVVASQPADDSSGTVVVSVMVGERDAPPIAGAASAGRVSLVQMAP